TTIARSGSATRLFRPTTFARATVVHRSLVRREKTEATGTPLSARIVRQGERDVLARIRSAADGDDDVLAPVGHVGHRRSALRRAVGAGVSGAAPAGAAAAGGAAVAPRPAAAGWFPRPAPAARPPPRCGCASA